MITYAWIKIAYMNKALFFQSKVEVQKYDQNHKDNIDNTGTTSIIQKREIVKEHIYQGNLLLINSTYPIRQESVKSDIVNLSKHNELINGYGLLNTNVYLSKEIAKKFSEMINNVVKEGVNQFLINSGYRDFDEQSGLYHEMRADYALPAGYSEHNSGLSLDVGIGLTKTDRAPEGKWIEKMLGNNALSNAIPWIKRMLQVFNMNLVIFAMSVCLTVRLCQNEFSLGRISGLFKRRREHFSKYSGEKIYDFILSLFSKQDN